MIKKQTPSIQRISEAEFDCSPKSYWRLATQRFEAANFLTNSTKDYLDAVYLAGHAAESSLKSMILAQTPRSRWADACQEISSGVKAHDFDFLAGILRRKNVPIPREIVSILDVIKLEWTTKLRYDKAVIPLSEPENFLKLVGPLHEWVKMS